MIVARLFEEIARGATVYDTSLGTERERIREALGERADALRRASADLVSVTAAGARVIEVKTRGGGAAGKTARPSWPRASASRAGSPSTSRPPRRLRV